MSHSRRSAGPTGSLATPSGIALLCLALGTLAGCGGSSNSITDAITGGGGTPVKNYAEVVTLPTGQTGALSLAVQPDNSVSGTLAVAGGGTAAASLSPHETGAPSPLPMMAAGVYSVTGTQADGLLSLAGAAFTLTGALPAGAAPVSFTLTVGAGPSAVVYTGTLATASNRNSALAGAYQFISITNPATGQTVTCPGTLAFGANNDDTCDAGAFFVFNTDGTSSVREGGATKLTSTYMLVGTILAVVTTSPATHQTNNDVFSVAVSSSAMTLTRLGTTDPTNQTAVGEQYLLTKSAV